MQRLEGIGKARPKAISLFAISLMALSAALAHPAAAQTRSPNLELGVDVGASRSHGDDARVSRLRGGHFINDVIEIEGRIEGAFAGVETKLSTATVSFVPHLTLGKARRAQLYGAIGAGRAWNDGSIAGPYKDERGPAYQLALGVKWALDVRSRTMLRLETTWTRADLDTTDIEDVAVTAGLLWRF